MGTRRISTAYSKFGGASLKLDGSSSTYVSVPASSDWNFSGDFTIDFWWYHSSNANSPIIDTGNGGCSLFIRDYYGTVQVFVSSNGASWDIANQLSMGAPSGTGFDHFALVRAGSTYYTFKNGVLTNSFVNPLSPYYDASKPLDIGRYGTSYATGYLDELRVSKGIVRWLSNFSPRSSQYTEGTVLPTAGFSASPVGGTSMLLILTKAPHSNWSN